MFVFNHVKTDFVHGGGHIPVLSFIPFQDSLPFSDFTTQFAEWLYCFNPIHNVYKENGTSKQKPDNLSLSSSILN